MSLLHVDRNKPLVEEYFVCTIRPDSVRAVRRRNEDGKDEMIHFENGEEARKFAQELASKYCKDGVRPDDPVLGFEALYTRSGGNMPYVNECLGRFGKNGAEEFVKIGMIVDPEPDEEFENKSVDAQISMFDDMREKLSQEDMSRGK